MKAAAMIASDKAVFKFSERLAYLFLTAAREDFQYIRTPLEIETYHAQLYMSGLNSP